MFRDTILESKYLGNDLVDNLLGFIFMGVWQAGRRGMLTFVGVGIALRSWTAVLIMTAFLSVAYCYRIQIEERALLSDLGDLYASYMKSTKRLIPFIF